MKFIIFIALSMVVAITFAEEDTRDGVKCGTFDASVKALIVNINCLLQQPNNPKMTPAFTAALTGAKTSAELAEST